jgi:hypothetical protein
MQQPPALDSQECTVVMCWAEAIAESLGNAPSGLGAVLDSAHPAARWRAGLGLPQLTPQLSRAIEGLDVLVRPTTTAGDGSLHALITAVRQDRTGETELDTLVRHLLRSALEQRQTRHMRTNGGASASR